MTPLIQLPVDVVSAGYKETRPLHYAQVFYSRACQFTGTEEEFLAAGHAYAYHQIDKFTRAVVGGLVNMQGGSTGLNHQ